MKYVAYYRVSTARQGKSGLGLEAQRVAVLAFINGNGADGIAEFTEVESGKRNNRPELKKALHLCRITGAKLVIAKLDRLSRNAAFLITLKDSGAEFVAADMPDANSFTVGIMALVAQQEREMISKRTKEALGSVKRHIEEHGWYTTNGPKPRTITRLGNPNGAAHLRGRGNREAVEAIKHQSNDRAWDILPVIEEIRARGHTSLGAIAAQLNARHVRTPRRGRWHRMTVKRVLERVG